MTRRTSGSAQRRHSARISVSTGGKKSGSGIVDRVNGCMDEQYIECDRRSIFADVRLQQVLANISARQLLTGTIQSLMEYGHCEIHAYWCSAT